MSISTRVKWDNILTATLVICALITTGLVVYRQFFVQSTAPASPSSLRAVFVPDWKSQLAKGVQLGPSSAPVQLIEFADFECPYCATLHVRLKAVLHRYPSEVALSYVHFPLPMHRFAIPAARVAECADDQGRFAAMHERLFEQQNEFGLKPWSEYATDAGVPDLAAFQSCIQSKDPVQRVVEGRQLGEQLDVQGTPTLIINGWKLGRPPSAEELDRMIKELLAGKRIF